MNEEFPLSLERAALARMFGVTEAEIPDACLEVLRRFDFRYRLLSPDEQDTLLQEKAISLERPLSKSGPERKPDWEQGWNETLTDYIDSGFQADALIPGYYHRGETNLRLFDRFVKPIDPGFRVNFLKILQAWIAEAYLNDVDHIYEFGCGPGHNLYAFAKINPSKTYWGMDWTTASQSTLAEIKRTTGWQINAQNFDMFNPNNAFSIAPNSAVLTIGMLEQAGKNFTAFMGYLLSQPAQLFVHIEPIRELHDPNTEFGKLAIRYMEERNYLNGFLDYLRAVENKGQIRISDCRKLLGSTNCDDWNLVVWHKT